MSRDPRPGRAGTPSIPLLFARAIVRRCPWCGRNKLFERWSRLPESCPRCGLRFEREEGAFLGSMAINFGITAIVFIAVLVVWIVLTLPDVPVLAVTVVAVVTAVALPLVLYPFTKTIWAAIDVVLHRMDPQDVRFFDQERGRTTS